jgi:hypothetical protein
MKFNFEGSFNALNFDQNQEKIRKKSFWKVEALIFTNYPRKFFSFPSAFPFFLLFDFLP